MTEHDLNSDGQRPQGTVASLSGSPARIALSLVSFGLLILALIWLATRVPPGTFVLQIVLLSISAIGALAMWKAWTSRDLVIYLTDQGLVDSHGEVLVSLGDIVSVQRGPFALKPARGFSVVALRPLKRRWVPGYWWRIGRRVGVGGVTSAGATRLMAETVDSMLSRQK